jgi:hypothetical protein
LLVLRGFSRNVKQAGEGSEATGGMRLRRMLPGHKIASPAAHFIFELFLKTFEQLRKLKYT